MLQNRLDGNVEFKKATFRYPTRPQVRVLRDLDLSVTSGQRIALVGPSGCGKSTCIQLLQRFYDLKNGELVSIFIIIFTYLRSKLAWRTQQASFMHLRHETNLLITPLPF